jgi:protein CpxP
MMRRKVLWITVVVAMATLGLASCKHDRHAGGFDRFDLEAAVNRAAARVDLDENQKADLSRIAEEIADKAKSMHAERETRLRELADLVRQPSVSREIVDLMVAEKMAKLQEMADFTAERLIAFHATLSEEQREKIAGLIEAHAEQKGCRFSLR